MKNRYFYTIVTAAAVLLCIPGCSEGLSEDTSSKAVLNESSDDGSSNEPVKTTVSTLTPLQTFERITDFEDITEFSEKSIKTAPRKDISEKEAVTEKPAEAADEWFSAHSLFTIREQEEEKQSDEEKTWFRFRTGSETTVTTVSAASAEKPGLKISGFKKSND